MFRGALIGLLGAGAVFGAAGLGRAWLQTAHAQAAGFHAIAVSSAPASSNVSHAWFIGQDGTARFCIAGQTPAPTCQAVPFH